MAREMSREVSRVSPAETLTWLRGARIEKLCRCWRLAVNSDMDELLDSPRPFLLKPSEVAAQLGVSRTWLYDAAKRGRIPSIRIGGEDGPLRFVPEDVDRWLDEARAAWRPGRPSAQTRTARPLEPVP